VTRLDFTSLTDSYAIGVAEHLPLFQDLSTVEEIANVVLIKSWYHLFRMKLGARSFLDHLKPVK
jgi:hypothetical protein